MVFLVDIQYKNIVLYIIVSYCVLLFVFYLLLYQETKSNNDIFLVFLVDIQYKNIVLYIIVSYRVLLFVFYLLLYQETKNTQHQVFVGITGTL